MKRKNNKKIYIFLTVILLISFGIVTTIITKNKSYAKETIAKEENNIKISNAKEIDIYQIIKNNVGEELEQKIEIKEEVLEFLTKYKNNSELPKGSIQVLQEGREGKQTITTRKYYSKEGEVVKEEQINAKVTKASVDKIVEIGTAKYSSNYQVKKGENIYVTSDRATITNEADSSSKKITTLHRNDELKVLEIEKEWYKISSGSIVGWIKKENATYKNPNQPEETQTAPNNETQIKGSLGFDMALNKPSGLTLEQFKKVLTDSKDKNKIFEQNAEYFYYTEKQYNINGLFIAAIGIHESAWGTSKIAKDKNNLFGYGAYDSNPYNGAYSFTTYSESIDLMARVLTKYYLNPAGTKIYNDEVAKGTYYNGPTFSGVNTKYATDKNWANAVFNHMKYLYNKL